MSAQLCGRETGHVMLRRLQTGLLASWFKAGPTDPARAARTGQPATQREPSASPRMTAQRVGARSIESGALAGLVLREAGPEDHDGLLALQMQICAWEAQHHPNRSAAPQKVRDTLARLVSWADAHEGRVIVAEWENRIVGNCICGLGDDVPPYLEDFDRRYGYIGDICVDEHFRSRGVGRLLLDEAEHHLAGRGVNQIQIGCLWGNARARALYEAVGYRPYELVLEKRLDGRGGRQ